MATVTTEQDRPTHVTVELAPRTKEEVRRAYFVALLGTIGIVAAECAHQTLQTTLAEKATTWVSGIAIGLAVVAAAMSMLRIMDRPKTTMSTRIYRDYLDAFLDSANVMAGISLLGFIGMQTPVGARMGPPELSWAFAGLMAVAATLTLMRTAERLQASIERPTTSD